MLITAVAFFSHQQYDPHQTDSSSETLLCRLLATAQHCTAAVVGQGPLARPLEQADNGLTYVLLEPSQAPDGAVDILRIVRDVAATSRTLIIAQAVDIIATAAAAAAAAHECGINIGPTICQFYAPAGLLHTCMPPPHARN
jgi:hypothetical protein